MDSTQLATSGHLNYHLVRILGRGAFGQAVLYRKTDDNSLVVWKEVELKRLDGKGKRESNNEVQLLSLLAHPNIVAYYNHFIDGDFLYIEMEYADKGNLCQKIMNADKMFDELDILWYLYQLLSACAYIHERSILHRDIKTLNIFLTRHDLVKLGDFGISRLLDGTVQMAESCVGTLYYMAPEIIKGQPYSYEADIWACGCVLYELLTRERPFEGTNMLRLANEIVSRNYKAISEDYSPELRETVRQMLADGLTEHRPSARALLENPLFDGCRCDFEARMSPHLQVARQASASPLDASTTTVRATKKTCDLFVWGAGKSVPLKLELFDQGVNVPVKVCVGDSHLAVLTVENEVFTWSVQASRGFAKMSGQLGHGDCVQWKQPKRVEALSEVHVIDVACGASFTVCLTDQGKLFTFGSNSFGCLGHGKDENEMEKCTRPTLVEALSHKRVVKVACGDSHVLALTNENEVYSWGNNEFGRLGTGDEDDRCEPVRVQLPDWTRITSLSAGPDTSFVITQEGRVLACGNNENNKLGLAYSVRGLEGCSTAAFSFDIPVQLDFTMISSLSHYQVASITAGAHHTAALDRFGQLITFGSNQFGQLGRGDFRRPPNTVHCIGGQLSGHAFTHVSCGDSFTVAATQDNEVYAWGNYENGRLGLGKVTSCVLYPRPVFGTMHNVARLCSRGWFTAMLAEQVLEDKLIRISRGADSRNAPGVTPDATDSGLCSAADTVADLRPSSPLVLPSSDSATPVASSFTDTEAPAWLADELRNCEMIPINQNQNQVQQSPPPAPQERNQAALKQAQDDLEAALSRRKLLIEQLASVDSEITRIQTVISALSLGAS